MTAMQPLSSQDRTRSRYRRLVNARLIDPASRPRSPRRRADRGRRHRRSRAAHRRRQSSGDAEIIDCGGRVLAPGLIDMMVFTGEPGHEHRETLATASRAAAAGGVTTIVCMPNTDPVIDDVALVDFILRRARDTALVNVHPMAAMTKGLLGEEMTEIGLLQRGRRHRLHQRQNEPRQRQGDAQRARLRQGFRRADRASPGRSHARARTA